MAVRVVVASLRCLRVGLLELHKLNPNYKSGACTRLVRRAVGIARALQRASLQTA